MYVTKVKKEKKVCSLKCLSQKRRYVENQLSKQTSQEETEEQTKLKERKDVNKKEMTKYQSSNKNIKSQKLFFININKDKSSKTDLKKQIINIRNNKTQYQFYRHLNIIKEYYDNFVLINFTLWMKSINFLIKRKKIGTFL